MLNLESILGALGGVPPLLVDLATFGLASLGGYVALKPPKETDKTLKRFYVVGFALLFLAGVAANLWLRSVESGKQEKLQQNETDARNQFSTNLRDLKISSNAILEFVANPPKGFSQAQVSSIVQEFMKGQKSAPEVLSDDVLKAMETIAEQQMHDIWARFDYADIALNDQQFVKLSPERAQKIAAARD